MSGLPSVDDPSELSERVFSSSTTQDSNTTLNFISPTTVIGRGANGQCYAVATQVDTAYFGNGGYLEIVDFSDPANPVLLGNVNTPSVVQGVTVVGTNAYVADDEAGLRVIDTTDPASPTEVGFVDTGDYVYGVAVSGTTSNPSANQG